MFGIVYLAPMSTSAFCGFSPKLLRFLGQLRRNNNREWFQDNKHRYESDVLEPALDFISAMDEHLAHFAPHFVAIPKRMGGSLMRVYRDTRFSKDKTPYKTNVGIQFRHELGRDVHAPGYYFHIDPDEVFLGAGMWRPAADALARIRDTIVDDPGAWKRARDNKEFGARFELRGESLTRPPRGYPKDHPCIEDLKRKDFIAGATLTHSQIQGRSIVKDVATLYRKATPFMRFLCKANSVQF